MTVESINHNEDNFSLDETNDILFSNGLNVSPNSTDPTQYTRLTIDQIDNLKMLPMFTALNLYEFYDSRETYIRPHFDIDLEWDQYDEQRAKDVLDVALFRIQGDFECSLFDIAIAHDKREDKCSYHLNVTNRYTTMADLCRWKHEHTSHLKLDSFDPAIYRDGWNKWRTLYAKKTGKSSNGLRPFSNHSDLDFMITYVNPSTMTRWSFGTSQPIPQPISIKVSLTGMEHKIQKFCDYLSCCNTKRFESRQEWFKLLCVVKNLDIPYDIFDTYCQSIRGYDKDENTRQYNSLNHEKGYRWKTLFEMAASDNPQQYEEMNKKYERVSTTRFSPEAFNKINQQVLSEDAEYQELLTFIQNATDFQSSEYKKKKHELAVLSASLAEKVFTRQKKYFETFHFRLKKPTVTCEIFDNEVDMYSAHDFAQINSNLYTMNEPFVPKWVKHATKLCMTYHRADFCPTGCALPIGYFNTYRGLAIESQPSTDVKAEDTEEFKMIINHIKLLTGHCTGGVEWILDWLTQLVQQPGVIPGVGILFISLPGCGKSLFVEELMNTLLGENFVLQTASIEHIVGRFASIDQKLVAVLDEAKGKDCFAYSDKLKNAMTSSKIQIEKKGIDAWPINNFTRFIFCSNNDIPLKVEVGDRRLCIFECSAEKRNNREYFGELHRILNDRVVVRQFYDFLMNRDIHGLNLEKTRPMTKIYKDLQAVNIPIIEPFLKYYMDEYKMPECLIEEENEDTKLQRAIILEQKARIKSSSLYSLYCKWYEKNRMPSPCGSVTMFGRDLAKYESQGISKIKQSIMYYTFDFVKLQLCLII